MKKQTEKDNFKTIRIGKDAYEKIVVISTVQGWKYVKTVENAINLLEKTLKVSK